ncbi:hypothetical protein BGZ65_006312, partial [Modicella reniformis]
MAESRHYQQRYDPPSSRSKQQQQQKYDRPHDLTPQSSFSSTVSRGDSSGSNKPIQQSQLSYLRSPAPSMGGAGPPSPISPSTSSPVDAMSSHLSLTRLDEPIQDRVSIQTYDRVVFHQPVKRAAPERVIIGPATTGSEQQYGTAVLKQTTSNGSTRSTGGSSRYPHPPSSGGVDPKLSSSSSASAHSVSSRGRSGSGSPSSPLRQSPSAGSGYSQQLQQQQQQQQRS